MDRETYNNDKILKMAIKYTENRKIIYFHAYIVIKMMFLQLYLKTEGKEYG